MIPINVKKNKIMKISMYNAKENDKCKGKEK